MDENKKLSKTSLGINLIFWWLFMTAIYSVLYFKYLDKDSVSTFGEYIAGFFGLFTPVGPLSLVLSFAPLFLVANLASVAMVIYVAKLKFKTYLPFGTNFLAALGILLLITIISDLLRFMPFASFAIFFQGRDYLSF